jgi:hypothetical protein
MLTDPRERLRNGPDPQRAPTKPEGPQLIAPARRDPQGQTVTLILDATANIGHLRHHRPRTRP